MAPALVSLITAIAGNALGGGLANSLPTQQVTIPEPESTNTVVYIAGGAAVLLVIVVIVAVTNTK